jgi:isoquinoline 1-oxidoreductase beta subunit
MTARDNVPKISRRQFIVASAAAGGGLAIGLHVPFAGAQRTATVEAGDAQLNLWVVVKPDDTCVIRIARAEMGQGTLTGLAQLVAEELECDWNKVATEGVTPGRNLAAKRAWGEMGTGGSRGIRTSQDYVRQAGAAARSMLVQAAANRWNVPPSELETNNGVITHKPSGRSVRYGEIAAEAAKVPAPDPKSMKLKDPRQWKVAGQPLHRLDTRDKLDGSKVYSIDVKMPGMLNAAIKQCPVFGGKLVSFDAEKVKRMKGVKGVVKVDSESVAVVADTWWHAKKALDALPINWDEGESAKVSSASIAEHLKAGLEASNAYVYRNEGDADEAIARAAKKVEAVYATPFLAHGTMEPMNCTARVTKDRAECWVPTQNAEASMAALSEESGIPLDKCEVNRTDLGCGFGRRGGNQDYTRQAAAIAKQFPGVPVKLIWSREEDIQHDFYRPISQCKLSAGLDEQGNVTGMHIRVSGQSINAFVNPASIADGKDRRQLQGMWTEPDDAQLGYAFPSIRIEYAMRNTHVPVGPWRGVNTNQNGVYVECFMEELARAAGKDSLEFRRQYMAKFPKHLGVLNAAAEKAGWGTPLPQGHFRGIAQFMGYFSYSAAVAEISLTPEGKVKVHRMVLALNCGHPVNPHQIAAQVEGSVAMGLSGVYFGEITIDKGRVVQSNFHDYRPVRIAEFPKVETVLVPTYDFWGGVGEPTICVVAPAVLNAIQAATGKPVRSLPLTNQNLA